MGGIWSWWRRWNGKGRDVAAQLENGFAVVLGGSGNGNARRTPIALCKWWWWLWIVTSVCLIVLQFLCIFVYFSLMGVGMKETLASQGKYKSIPQLTIICPRPWQSGMQHIQIFNMYRQNIYLWLCDFFSRVILLCSCSLFLLMNISNILSRVIYTFQFFVAQRMILCKLSPSPTRLSHAG